jgi:hypothetical protein
MPNVGTIDQFVFVLNKSLSQLQLAPSLRVARHQLTKFSLHFFWIQCTARMGLLPHHSGLVVDAQMQYREDRYRTSLMYNSKHKWPANFAWIGSSFRPTAA